MQFISAIKRNIAGKVGRVATRMSFLEIEQAVGAGKSSKINDFEVIRMAVTLGSRVL